MLLKSLIRPLTSRASTLSRPSIRNIRAMHIQSIPMCKSWIIFVSLWSAWLHSSNAICILQHFVPFEIYQPSLIAISTWLLWTLSSSFSTFAHLFPGVGSSNNYAYLVTDDQTKDSVIIDPANPPEVTPILTDLKSSNSINLTAIVNTHHHWDHAGGNSKILAEFSGLPIIGGKDCEAVTKTPKNGETFMIGKGIKVTALYTPCHTQDSICWFMQDGDEKVVFTGDTLFIGGELSSRCPCGETLLD